MDFFDFFSKLSHQFWLILCMKLEDYKGYNFAFYRISGKTLVRLIKQVLWTPVQPKTDYYYYYYYTIYFIRLFSSLFKTTFILLHKVEIEVATVFIVTICVVLVVGSVPDLFLLFLPIRYWYITDRDPVRPKNFGPVENLVYYRPGPGPAHNLILIFLIFS